MSAAVGIAKALSHEEVFLERYDQLLKWAVTLTKPDRELARDLVQEAFLQFSLSSGDLVAVNNIDSYLYGVVRNTYLSYLRRTPTRFQLPFEMDGPQSLLLTVDPREQIHARDELVAICQRACVRKETSVAASLLILRFFHGYLPEEIAKLTNRTRNVVDVQLKLARWEATSSSASKSLLPRGKRNSANEFRVNVQGTCKDLLTQLRHQIFSTRRGECIDREQFSRFENSNKPVPRNSLSHLVSCLDCLDHANRILGLASLKDRNVLDLLGRAKASVESTSGQNFVRQCVLLLSGWTFWGFLNFSEFFVG